MAKAVEITFAIGAALAGSFAGTFGKAGKALSDFQKQTEQMQKQAGQIESYQKMQGAINNNAVEVQAMHAKAQALNAQAEISKTRTQELSAQYRTAQQETSRLNAENVRNTDAYKAAQLNVKSLANQISASSQPTAELQRQYKAAQEEVHRLEGAMKSSSAALKEARKNEQGLAQQVKASKRETKSLTDESKSLTEQGDKLKQTIDRDKESLSRMTTELKAAGIDTRNLASEQARLTQQSQRMSEAQARYQRSKAALDQTRQNLSWNNIRGELMTAAGLGYTLYKPVSQAADFESAMARVNAVAFSGAGRDSTADAESLKALTEQARQLGRDTQFTAVQAAQSQENLARAGFKANEIISSMPGLLNMAAAEGMDLAQASDIAASTLRGFKLSADQMNRVADVLAQTSAASNTNIVGLGEGMKYVAPIAANLGVSLEETSAMLGVMANAGIKGTEGGTALRGAFLRLAQEPKAVEKALNRLGVASRDAKGNMRQLPDLMLELSEKMKDMGEADKTKYLADIFGVRAVSGMMAVMNGALDGSLEKLRRYNYEATGELKAISEAVGVSTEKMWEGMKGSEPFMQRLGISFRDLSIYTAMLAKSGITGAAANSQLTATFSRLAKDSKSVQKALKGYNISLFKDDGGMRDLPDVLHDINNAIKDMDEAKQLEAITKIFGAEAMPGAQALLAQLRAGAFSELDKKATENAIGVSREMADKVMNTLKGQMTAAGSAVEGFMIIVGDVLLPTVKELVSTFTGWMKSLAELAKAHPEITKYIVGTVGALAALKVGFVGVKIGWNLLKLPFQTGRVALDLLNIKLLSNADAVTEAGKRAGLLSKVWGGLKSGAKGVGKGIWNAFKFVGKGAFDVGKLALYYSKQLLITAATKTWTAAQWLWNAAMSANPIGAIIAAIAAAIAIGYLMYKNWDKIKAWWDSWTVKDVFAVIKDYASRAVSFVYELWLEMWKWIGSLVFENIFEPIIGYVQSAYDYVVGKWVEFCAWWDSLSLGDIFAGVKDFALGAWNYAKGLWDSFSLKDILPEGFSFSWDGVIAGWENVKGIISSADFSGIWSSLATGFATVCDTIKGAWTGVTDFIKGAWDTASEYVSGAWKWTKGLFGYDTDAEDLETQIQDITALNKMSENFSQRVAEMTAAWQPFKTSLGEGFQQIYTVMQGVADRIRGVTIPAVNELASALSRVATELTAIVKAGNLEVDVKIPNQGMGNNVPRTITGRKRAEGGFITKPELALIGEAGREVIIPLEKQSRGAELWLKAGKELGTLSQLGNITPHATGGIFSQPHIGLVAEAGREAVIPLEDKSRGLPLLMAAGEELGFSFGGSSASTNSISPVFAPNVNITVSGGDGESESKFRGILQEVFEDLFNEFQERMQRVSFA